MKSVFSFLSFTLLFSLLGCSSTSVVKFDEQQYPPTDKAEIFSDGYNVPQEYFEIGYVEAEGALFYNKQKLLNSIIKKAKQNGADALINLEFLEPDHPESSNKKFVKAVMIRYKE